MEFDIQLPKLVWGERDVFTLIRSKLDFLFEGNVFNLPFRIPLTLLPVAFFSCAVTVRCP